MSLLRKRCLKNSSGFVLRRPEASVCFVLYDSLRGSFQVKIDNRLTSTYHHKGNRQPATDDVNDGWGWGGWSLSVIVNRWGAPTCGCVRHTGTGIYRLRGRQPACASRRSETRRAEKKKKILNIITSTSIHVGPCVTRQHRWSVQSDLASCS